MVNSKDNHEPSGSSHSEPGQKPGDVAALATTETAPQTEETKGCASKNKYSWVEVLGVIFIGLAFLASAAAAGFTGWQAYIARDIEHRQLRAYVTGEMSHLYSFTPNSDVSGVITVRNDGLTPAYNELHQAAVRAFPDPLPDNFQFPPIQTEWSPHIIIFPRDSFFYTFVAKNPGFDKETIDEIIAGHKSIYILANIIYKDTFRNWRYTVIYFKVRQNNPDALAKLASGYLGQDLPIIFDRIGKEEGN